ncbi:MAG: SIS domain-containing protein [Bdellovibrionota bacterium]
MNVEKNLSLPAEIWRNSLNEAKTVLDRLINSQEIMEAFVKISDLMVETLRGGGRIFSCGNGGSMCDAMHFAEELTGRYRNDRPPLGAMALNDPSHLTCVSNDYGFEHVFARQLLGLARSGDLLLIISTSGKSGNLIEAAKAAKAIPIKTIGLLGGSGGEVKQLCDFSIVVPGATSERIQELQIKLIHMWVEVVEGMAF